MPLFRYRVGDLGRFINSDCPCGNVAPRIEIEGRIHDSISKSDGQQVTSQKIADLLYAQRELDQFQLVEKRNNVLELTVVAVQGAQPDNQKYERLLSELLGVNRKIRIRNARTILPESGGKFRWVKAMKKSSQK